MQTSSRPLKVCRFWRHLVVRNLKIGPRGRPSIIGWNSGRAAEGRRNAGNRRGERRAASGERGATEASVALGRNAPRRFEKISLEALHGFSIAFLRQACRSCPTRAGLRSRIRADASSATRDTDRSQRPAS
ncbi:hypothetical protein EYF80_040168 [Liparis tanakae]|uniref:Uncharacterized protein n=1 Tax=Liparis tanakae TaxID=230148 RepID=A0A4Z2G8W4_9TELE|nr:hypothetical protein EYF80_040168 [Liparis tanakae]